MAIAYACGTVRCVLEIGHFPLDWRIVSKPAACRLSCLSSSWCRPRAGFPAAARPAFYLGADVRRSDPISSAPRIWPCMAPGARRLSSIAPDMRALQSGRPDLGRLDRGPCATASAWPCDSVGRSCSDRGRPAPVLGLGELAVALRILPFERETNGREIRPPTWCRYRRPAARRWAPLDPRPFVVASSAGSGRLGPFGRPFVAMRQDAPPDRQAAR